MTEPRHWFEQRYVGMLPFARCACGWEGPTRSSDTDAADDFRQHRRDAEGTDHDDT